MTMTTGIQLDSLQTQGICHPLETEGFRLSPESAAQVAEILHRAETGEQSLALSLPEAQQLPVPLWLDLSGLKAIRRHRATDFVLTVESGISCGELADTLKPLGQRFPLQYPADKRLVDVLAEDCPSLETGFGGYPRDYVLGLEIATPDGQLTHCGGEVVKNVTGYDLNKLYIGSHHTLGVITAVTLKLMATPESARSWLFEFQNIQKAFQSVHQLLQSELPLMRCELFHQHRLQSQVDSASSQHGVAPWQLFLEIAGDTSLLKQMASLVRELVVYPDAESSLMPLREAELGQALSQWPAEALVVELAMPKAHLEAFYLEIQMLAASYGTSPVVQLRPAAGLLYLLWPEVTTQTLEILSPFLEALQFKLQEKGGVLQILQAPPGWISRMARYNLPADPLVRQLMARLKATYDPNGVLHNSRLPLGCWEEALT